MNHSNPLGLRLCIVDRIGLNGFFCQSWLAVALWCWPNAGNQAMRLLSFLYVLSSCHLPELHGRLFPTFLTSSLCREIFSRLLSLTKTLFVSKYRDNFLGLASMVPTYLPHLNPPHGLLGVNHFIIIRIIWYKSTKTSLTTGRTLSDDPSESYFHSRGILRNRY